MIQRFTLTAVFAAALCAQPRITSIQNHAANIVAGMPNYAIAQGSIMAIRGTGLGPAEALTQEPDLDRNLGGVSVRITGGGSTTEAIPIRLPRT